MSARDSIAAWFTMNEISTTWAYRSADGKLVACFHLDSLPSGEVVVSAVAKSYDDTWNAEPKSWTIATRLAAMAWAYEYLDRILGQGTRLLWWWGTEAPANYSGLDSIAAQLGGDRLEYVRSHGFQRQAIILNPDGSASQMRMSAGGIGLATAYRFDPRSAAGSLHDWIRNREAELTDYGFRRVLATSAAATAAAPAISE